MSGNFFYISSGPDEFLLRYDRKTGKFLNKGKAASAFLPMGKYITAGNNEVIEEFHMTTESGDFLSVILAGTIKFKVADAAIMAEVNVKDNRVGINSFIGKIKTEGMEYLRHLCTGYAFTYINQNRTLLSSMVTEELRKNYTEEGIRPTFRLGQVRSKDHSVTEMLAAVTTQEMMREQEIEAIKKEEATALARIRKEDAILAVALDAEKHKKRNAGELQDMDHGNEMRKMKNESIRQEEKIRYQLQQEEQLMRLAEMKSGRMKIEAETETFSIRLKWEAEKERCRLDALVNTTVNLSKGLQGSKITVIGSQDESILPAISLVTQELRSFLDEKDK